MNNNPNKLIFFFFFLFLDNMDDLIGEASNGDIKKMQAIIQKQTDPEFINRQGLIWTNCDVMETAIEFGNLNVVEFLLSCTNFNLVYRTARGQQSYFHIAARFGRRVIFRRLLKEYNRQHKWRSSIFRRRFLKAPYPSIRWSGYEMRDEIAGPFSVSRYSSSTPLDYCCGNYGMVRYLLELKADPGSSVMSAMPSLEIVQLLIRYGANVNASGCSDIKWCDTQEKATPLLNSVGRNDTKMVRCLLDAKANLDFENVKDLIPKMQILTYFICRHVYGKPSQILPSLDLLIDAHRERSVPIKITHIFEGSSTDKKFASDYNVPGQNISCVFYSTRTETKTKWAKEPERSVFYNLEKKCKKINKIIITSKRV